MSKSQMSATLWRIPFLLGLLSLLWLQSGCSNASSDEPSYDGKLLSDWLRDLNKGPDRGGYDARIYEPAVKAIQHIGTNALPTLLKIVETGEMPQAGKYKNNFDQRNPYLAAAGFRILGPLAKPAVPKLTAFLAQTNETSVLIAMHSLIGLKEDQRILTLLTNSNTNVVQAAIIALGEDWITAEAVPPLVSLLKSREMAFRYYSAWTLGRIHKAPETAIPGLIAALNDESGEVRKNALGALNSFQLPSTNLVPILIEAIEDSHPPVRAVAVGMIGDICRFDRSMDDRVVPALTMAADDVDEHVRVTTMASLETIFSGRLGGAHPRDRTTNVPFGSFSHHARNLIALLIRKLSDPRPMVREHAAYALGEIGPISDDDDAPILAALIEAAKDRNKEVQFRAKGGLSNFQDTMKRWDENSPSTFGVQSTHLLESWGPQKNYFYRAMIPLIPWQRARTFLAGGKIVGGTQYKTGWLLLVDKENHQSLTGPPYPDSLRQFAEKSGVDVSKIVME